MLAAYWRLTGEQLDEMQVKECDTAGVFLMLDALEHENPLIRHATKNWLIDSIPLFFRVVDPLFAVLLDLAADIRVSGSKQLIYAKAYEAQRVNEVRGVLGLQEAEEHPGRGGGAVHQLHVERRRQQGALAEAAAVLPQARSAS